MKEKESFDKAEDKKNAAQTFFGRMNRLQKEAFLKAMTYITAAFGLVAGLAWNEAIKALLNLYFKEGSNIISKFIYAVFITIIVVMVTMYIGRLENKLKK